MVDWNPPAGAYDVDFRNQTRLKSLDMRISGAMMINLPQSLQRIAVHGGRGIAMVMPNRPKSLPNLEYLACQTMWDVSQYIPPRSTACNVRTLQVADVHQTESWSDSGILSKAFKSLEHLQLRYAKDVDTQLAPILVEHCKGLRSLDLYGSDSSGCGVKMLVQGLAHLSKLSLGMCDSLSADAVQWARDQSVQVISHREPMTDAKCRKVRYDTFY